MKTAVSKIGSAWSRTSAHLVSGALLPYFVSYYLSG